MSYDVNIVDSFGHTVRLAEKHQLAGGTYCAGGTATGWLSITYNYSKHYYGLLHEDGLNGLEGMTRVDAVPLLARAIGKLGTKRDPDYWLATPGNAGAALQDLLTLVLLCPTGTIRIT